jgi:pyruvate formate lyase activating enzyme
VASIERQAVYAPVASLPCVSAYKPTSAAAWPGRSSAEILLGGCNLRCAYCCCPEMLGDKRGTVSVDLVVSHLRDHSRELGGVVISGGEPTANPGLTSLLRSLSVLELPVRIDTNGTYPTVLEELIAENLVAFVALDVKTTPDRYDPATGSQGSWPRVMHSIETILGSGVDHEFRTTCYSNVVNTADLPSIARELEGGNRYVVQQFRPQRTLDPAASGVRPYDADALRRAALCCSVHLPTVVRGV